MSKMKIAFGVIMALVLGVASVAIVITATKRENPPDLSLKGRVDKIVVEKEKRILHLYENGKILKSYPNIALGGNPKGHKQFEGDSRTPEGIYTIDSKNPNSRYFLNLGISYPNKQDRQNAAKLGKSPGGDIKIHGLPNGFGWADAAFQSYGDWTNGCIALDNERMRELYEVVEIGTEIEILE